mmetsp:Transcript_407/g.1109  ORF Transcript_407/g.1109 Transcript_407/m.1109 type:complete len:211 (+) Transcript_407:1058-1690(+)
MRRSSTSSPSTGAPPYPGTTAPPRCSTSAPSRRAPPSGRSRAAPGWRCSSRGTCRGWRASTPPCSASSSARARRARAWRCRGTFRTGASCCSRPSSARPLRGRPRGRGRCACGSPWAGTYGPPPALASSSTARPPCRRRGRPRGQAPGARACCWPSPRGTNSSGRTASTPRCTRCAPLEATTPPRPSSRGVGVSRAPWSAPRRRPRRRGA